MKLHETGSRAQIAARVPDDWYVGFHRGLAARFWRAAGATMAEDDAQASPGLALGSARPRRARVGRQDLGAIAVTGGRARGCKLAP